MSKTRAIVAAVLLAAAAIAVPASAQAGGGPHAQPLHYQWTG
jgi:Spy/CpxP family protein refolding chaperone